MSGAPAFNSYATLREVKPNWRAELIGIAVKSALGWRLLQSQGRRT
jgi:hypothetical protein